MFELENSHKKILLGLHIKWMFSDINFRCSQFTVSRLRIFVGKVLIGTYFSFILGVSYFNKTMNMLIDWTKKFKKDGVQSELMKLKYLTSIILWCRNFNYKMKYINQTYWKRKLPIVRKHHSKCILIRCPLKRYSCKAVYFVFDLYTCTTCRNFQSLQRLRPQQLRAWWK